jgi:xanthine dehydrogenase accessory factor
VEGHDDATIARIHSPIGSPDLVSKDPATIALGVAGELVRTFLADPTGVRQ